MDRQSSAKVSAIIGFFILGLIIHAAAMALPAVQCDDRQLNRAVNLLNTLALVCALIFSVSSLLTSQLWDARLPLPFVGRIHLAWDGITLFLPFTFQLLSLAGSVYAIGYLEHYVEQEYAFAGIWCRSRCIPVTICNSKGIYPDQLNSMSIGDLLPEGHPVQGARHL